MATITYAGVQLPGGRVVSVAHLEDGRQAWAENLPHVHKHSSEFAWGYAGSGPADLARSILAHAVGMADADRYYQAFKRAYVVHWGREWSITQDNVREWVESTKLLERAGVVG